MNNRILTSLSYGMFAIGTKGEKMPNACIVNTVMQITSKPLTVAVSVNHNNYTNECIKKNGEFTVSVFSEKTSGAVIGALGFTSGRDNDKLANVKHEIISGDMPIIQENICCWFKCKVISSVETSTHTVFIGELTDGSETVTGTPMTYKFYHDVIKGKAPKNAPTYVEETKQTAEKYVCKICKYEYNDSNVPFEDLPDDWVCPICGASKSEFVKEATPQETAPQAAETSKYICEICKYEYDDPNVPFEDLPDDWVCPICNAPKSAFVKE